ncbi:3-oxoacyl-[acyl-carrier protein] reductase [Caballeronia arationis]|jgi:3-oxoacyl-[acyl-carrier protein] reductase|uniref:3-oxoacyl-[acyl-carrier protein] reductase n=1 Tax=Caballeronia arationis TaxID=1777142 RepID=A0A7Z7I0X1_9BURK|nr:SDR family oxidoreductase [Caballeronia arationis]SOE46263.1 3-oxoacyl-[acyl-carrier protein] reductase [Caballeronia arationis]
MDLGISGKRALVTGASKGLGFAVCEALANEGVNLMLFARNIDQLASAQADLKRRFEVEVDTFAGDMTSGEDIKRLGLELRAKNGCDILILNTARPPHPLREFLEETEPERWDIAYRTQLLGACLVLQEVAPQLIEKGWGRIVAITSATVKQPLPLHALSTVFRAGLMGGLKQLANEIAPSGVTVNSVSPAAIRTEAFAETFDSSERAKLSPMKRLGTLEEFAGTVAFLASQQAGYIHGTNVQVDGGANGSIF